MRQGIVTKYILRNPAGGGTVYWKEGKSFPKSVLDVMSALEAQGFQIP